MSSTLDKKGDISELVSDFIKFSSKLFELENNGGKISKDQRITDINEEIIILGRLEFIFELIYQDRKHFEKEISDKSYRQNFKTLIEKIKKDNIFHSKFSLIPKILKKPTLKEVLEEELTTLHLPEEIQVQYHQKRPKGLIGGLALSCGILGVILLFSSTAFAFEHKTLDGTILNVSEEQAIKHLRIVPEIPNLFNQAISIPETVLKEIYGNDPNTLDTLLLLRACFKEVGKIETKITRVDTGNGFSETMQKRIVIPGIDLDNNPIKEKIQKLSKLSDVNPHIRQLWNAAEIYKGYKLGKYTESEAKSLYERNSYAKNGPMTYDEIVTFFEEEPSSLGGTVQSTRNNIRRIVYDYFNSK